MCAYFFEKSHSEINLRIFIALLYELFPPIKRTIIVVIKIGIFSLLHFYTTIIAFCFEMLIQLLNLTGLFNAKGRPFIPLMLQVDLLRSWGIQGGWRWNRRGVAR